MKLLEVYFRGKGDYPYRLKYIIEDESKIDEVLNKENINQYKDIKTTITDIKLNPNGYMYICEAWGYEDIMKKTKCKRCRWFLSGKEMFLFKSKLKIKFQKSYF